MRTLLNASRLLPVLLSTLVLLLSSFAGGAARAALHEEQMDVPVQVVDRYGKPVAQKIRVTVWSDDRNPVPAPVLVLNHGRATTAEERLKLGRARYGEASRYFVGRGFIVAVPTRIGYGVSGGEDVEDAGDCRQRDYPPVFAAAADQVLTVLATVRQRPDAAPDRAVLVGQSVGGATVMAAAARNPAGVQAVFNFAGGAGGDPKNRPERPCATAQMERLYRGFGETARVPSLWVYAENDQYFGSVYPREWFGAFRDAGGVGEFLQVPPAGDDGHLYFSRFAPLWQPAVGAFLDAHGFAFVARP